MAKSTILILFGGESPEHEVSLMSAKNIAKALSPEKYDKKFCYIDRQGRWLLAQDVAVPEQSVTLFPVLGEKCFSANTGERIAVDVIFPVLHGPNGEDGTVQGLAQLIHLPIVGPSLLAATVSIDKALTKQLIEAKGVRTAPWQLWETHHPRPSFEDVSHSLGPVLFVKPNSAGSSVGVTKVSTAEEFEAALAIAAQYDTRVLIEQAIEGRELEVAVLGTYTPEVSVPGEVIAGHEFYDYEDKYSDTSQASTIIPAESISDEVVERIRFDVLTAYKATRGSGMARVDLFLTEDDTVYIGEINGIPGFTDISMYPKLWEYDGLGQTALLDRLVEDALQS